LQASAKIPTDCKACGGHILVVDVLEKLYELAQKTGAEVEFVEPGELLDSTDIVAALLRY
jgi:peptide chain release factor subunit 1